MLASVQVIVSLDLTHINYMAIETIICVYVLLGFNLWENPERFIESNTKNSWIRYLNNMSIQGTWADALIIQTVADVLKAGYYTNSRIWSRLCTTYHCLPSSGKKYFVYNYYRSYWWMPLCINHCLTIKCLHFYVQCINGCYSVIKK